MGWVIMADLSLDLQDMLSLALLQSFYVTPVELSIMVHFLQVMGMGMCLIWRVGSHPLCPDMDSGMGMGM